MPGYNVPSQVCPRSEETTGLFPQWTGRFRQKQMPLGGGLEAEPRGRRRKGGDRNNLSLRVRPIHWTAQKWKQPGEGVRVKLIEQSLGIPSCEVLGTGH